MQTFGELLSQYIERTGVPDAELARTLGVSRQTIFRWREGETQRPRSRDDVMHLAAKLRLSTDERDALLLAAGFAPVTPLPPGEQVTTSARSTTVEPIAGHQDEPELTAAASRRPWRIVATVLILVAVLSGALLWWLVSTKRLPGTVTDPGVAPAATGETLILIGQFANYGGSQMGYNVAGRLQEALQSELAGAGLSQTRVETLKDVVSDPQTAERVGSDLGAALVVWGEYDSGRVLAYVSGLPGGDGPASPEVRRLVANPGELSATINAGLPEEIRWLALYVLGQVHFQVGRDADAETVFRRALAKPPVEPRALAVIQFYLAAIAGRRPNPDWSEVIALYSDAIDRRPEIVSAWNNRGAAYLNRNAPGDVVKAAADFRQVVAMAPGNVTGHFNLGLALAKANPDDLAPALASFRAAHDLAPDEPGPNNALCWNLSLAGKAAEAMPFCDTAVARDDSGMSLDSRGLTNALLGRHMEAASDFSRFLDVLRSRDSAAFERYAATRQPWIDALRVGRSPFDGNTLVRLRREP